MFEEGRGRPRGRSSLYYANFYSMVLIASKHDLDPESLVDAFFEAWEHGSSQCGELKISCREGSRGSAVFLITKGEKVVWQFPVNLEGIRSSDARDYVKGIPMPDKVKKKTYDKDQKVGDLRFGMKGVTVTGKIVEISPARRVFTRWGTEAHVSAVKISDETGSIRLSLWNNQIDLVHVGDEVEILNCSVSRFAGELQLRLGRKGSISVIDHPKKEELIQIPT